MSTAYSALFKNFKAASVAKSAAVFKTTDLEASKILTASCQSELKWHRCSCWELSGSYLVHRLSRTSASELAGCSVGSETRDRRENVMKTELCVYFGEWILASMDLIFTRHICGYWWFSETSPSGACPDDVLKLFIENGQGSIKNIYRQWWDSGTR